MTRRLLLRATCYCAAALLAAGCLPARDEAAEKVAHAVDALVADSPEVARGFSGYKFVDLSSNEVLAERNASSFFSPASNTKLYTTALALVRLGTNFTFRTEVRTDGLWKPGQASIHNLTLVGGGDPNLSGRVLPYQVKAKDGDPLTALTDLADQLQRAGVREVTGDVIGLSTRYPGDPYPDGWTLDDAIYGYGAPVTALVVNDNLVSITLQPATKVGNTPELSLKPALPYFVFMNEVMTVPGRDNDIHVARRPGSREVVLSGKIGRRSEPWKEDLGVDDGAQFAAEALIYLLANRGITVRGHAASSYRAMNEVPDPGREIATVPTGTLLAAHVSPPLWQALQVVNKVSQNLHAEMLLREVGYQTHGIGTMEAAKTERDRFLNEAKITPDGSGYALDDGSGLARQDLTTPDSTVALLTYMWQRPERDLWIQTLPIGGVDGSLEHRFRHVADAERIHAKTGSISHINTLSGYIEAKDHHWLAFSVMVNSTAAKEKPVREFIDRLCGLFLAYRTGAA